MGLYLAPSVRVRLVDERLFASTLGAGRMVFIPLSTWIKVSDVTKALSLDQGKKKKRIKAKFLLNLFIFRCDMPCRPLNLDGATWYVLQ